MRFTYRSSSDLFTKALKEYAEEKLGRPAERHRIETHDLRFDCESEKHRDRIALRVLMSYPGVKITVSTLHQDAYAAVDLAVDKIERKLRETDEKRRALARRPARPGNMDHEENDLMTQDEEEVLREMGALEEVEASMG
ncbi:MAG: ribosome-associated translation inhibitor RaiA [Proteobacteria bacterium]|nr:ribosome-associated translation inhibitor RaiA [Pseudomonadota bacterium]MCP4921002.1 ribosome-associated translation inhibitor RaiA [Pseudomonadota bacterium]